MSIKDKIHKFNTELNFNKLPLKVKFKVLKIYVVAYIKTTYKMWLFKYELYKNNNSKKKG